MPRPVVARFVRLSRNGLGVTLALALSVLCGVIGVAGAAASTAPMAAMPGMTGSPMVTTATVAPGVAHSVAPSAWETPLSLGSGCEHVCLTEAGAVCAAAGLAAITLLGLLLTSRRNTFTGLLARARTRGLPRRRRRPWSLLSPITLCVLRV